MLNIGCKLSDRNFGAKVSVCFPRGDAYDDHAAKLKKILSKHADKIESLLLSGELEAVFDGVRQGWDGHSSALVGNAPPKREPEAALPSRAEEASANAERDEDYWLEDWPDRGGVSVRDIVHFWSIGRSSFLNRVREGIFSPALELEDRAPNAPKLWDAAVVGPELVKAGYVRRGFNV